MSNPARGRLHAAAEAAQRLWPPSSAGLNWPRRGDGASAFGEEERARLVHYERLMGMAHVVAVAIALMATVVHIDVVTTTVSARGWFGALLGGAFAFAVA